MAAPIPPRPNRLVYLLDHEYKQRGLNWSRLKGVDAERAALLRAAAERAGCQAVLALAEVKETWDAWPSGSDPGDDYDYYDDEDEDDEAEDYGYHDASRDRGGDHDDYQLNELIDDEITLGWWTSPDGTGGEPISLHVPDSEVCATTPSADLTPCQSEYEGYMGNYGNTLDRWYRRAAVVVWARDRAFAARAKAGSQEALSELRARIGAGDLDGARAAAESLAPFWNKIGSRAGLLGTAQTWRRAWARPGRRRCCWSRSGWRRPRRSTPTGLRQQPGSTARSGRAGSSTDGSGRSTTSKRTGTSGSRGCRGYAEHCVPPGLRRRRGCWPPAPGAGWATSCGCGPSPRGRPLRGTHPGEDPLMRLRPPRPGPATGAEGTRLPGLLAQKIGSIAFSQLLHPALRVTAQPLALPALRGPARLALPGSHGRQRSGPAQHRAVPPAGTSPSLRRPLPSPP